MSFFITNAAGERELFSRRKLERSLRRAGASGRAVREVADRVLREPKSFRTTRDVYRHAFEYLKKTERPAAARYNLKGAIMELGPEGYLFEQFIGAILRHDGYAVRTDQTVQGHCVRHEIDVIAEKDNRHYLVECKLHNSPGTKTDVKVALYVKARFDDIVAYAKVAEAQEAFHQAWLVTNTKFTLDAIQYGTCSNLRMIGWAYPGDGGLETLITRYGLHPVTCLTLLTPDEKARLLRAGVLLCRDLAQSETVLRRAGFSDRRTAQILQEAESVCPHGEPSAAL